MRNLSQSIEKEFFRVKEAAEKLNCSIHTVYRLCEQKKIIATREFGPWLIFKKELEQKIEKAKNHAMPE